MKKIRWGVLSTAKIGVEKVIPAMQAGKFSEITAIASRNWQKATTQANKLKIKKAYGSYDELLADGTIDAVYNPLPNHLHVDWSIKSLAAGKHVLCEKPIGLNYEDAKRLQNEATKYPDLKIMEAFMYRHHPRILKTRELIDTQAIGKVQNIHAVFTYNNTDPVNIRNQADIGGGGLLDIGCYCISISRFFFDAEPHCVSAFIDYDPNLKIDRLGSVILKFQNGSATFTCATQLFPQQHVVISGQLGKIEIEIPFTPQPDKRTKLSHYTEVDKFEYIFDPCDQYTIQGDLFSEAILNKKPVPTPLTDATANMRVIDKIFESAKTGKFISL